MMREVTRVQDERREVEDEGDKELIIDGAVVTLPHEVYKDSNLGSCEDLIIVGLREDLDKTASIVANEDPVEVEDLGLNLLEVGVVSTVCFWLDCIAVLHWSV